MNGPRNRQLSEVSQREKDKYMILLIYGILKNGTNELTYKTEIESQMQKTNMVTREKAEDDKLGDWD